MAESETLRRIARERCKWCAKGWRVCCKSRDGTWHQEKRGELHVRCTAPNPEVLIEELSQENAALKDGKSRKMFVWTALPEWVAVAQAPTLEEAREAVLKEIGTSHDGPCPARERADTHVRTKNPSIWYGTNAEFALTDSAELEEQELHSRTMEKRAEVAEQDRERLSEALRECREACLAHRHNNRKWYGEVVAIVDKALGNG
jgi:hypothetical protein